MKVIRDDNKIPDLIKQLKHLESKRLEVGVFEGEKHPDSDIDLAELARIHEYGIVIEVTPEMRAYLHSIGLHLRDDTTHIRIPERSFIRAGWDNNKADVEKRIERFLPQVLELNVNTDTFIEMVGKEVEGRLKKFLKKLHYPPNSSFTIRRKGSSNPLIDTGSLVDSITHRVKSNV